MNKDNKYTKMQRNQYDSATNGMHKNHVEHDSNPDYWDILLGPIQDNKEYWIDKVGLDFGCGWGRNVKHMASLTSWKKLYGCDISQGNIDNCYKHISKEIKQEHEFYVTDGISLKEINGKDIGKFDFIMATIVLQHICVRDIRLSILKSMYEHLNKDGMISIQMGYDEKGQKHHSTVDYYDNNYDAPKTNSACDTRIDKKEYLIKDLEEIGFKNIKTTIKNSWSDSKHHEWIYVYGYK